MAGDPYFGEAVILERAVLGSYMPLFGSNGDVIGMMFSGKYLDTADATIFDFVRTGLIIVAILIVLSLLAILYITRRIVAPIYVMSKAALEMAEGNTNVNVEVTTKDEMRVLGDAFERMIVDTRKQVDAIEHIAAGDLTVKVDTRSHKDVMNNALIKMLQLNNNVFSNIAAAATQVTFGSQHMADSSQNLAQGATEQAATVQELSASIAEISEKTKTSAVMAGDAAKLAETIKTNAENGNRQMDEMIKAVKDINEASHDISRVIKVIDDIAFQTNILALNAAVEAARAGQHGKGFAVVADEVRSLASKSAEAAQNTGTMISDSMAKAEMGTKIAAQTAESLTAIIAGIQESDRLISEIAISSQEQALNIAQVNDGVDQVAQVVQQNSATAEENAAAAEEMSSQAAVLRQLISKFSLSSECAANASSMDGMPNASMPDMDTGGSNAFSLSSSMDPGKY
jgi:methyl-accepting chemotaxis protein